MAAKNQTIVVQGTEINIMEINQEDYISLTDMVKNQEDGLSLIEKWLRNKNTLEFLGIWERINNPGFNSPEFGGIIQQAGFNRFTLSVKKWNEKTQAIGLVAKTGRFGSGTYAHKDIAFEFGAWLSPEFKLYLIKEFQRLKDADYNLHKQKWNLHRILSKINYRIHTDAIKEGLIPLQITKAQAVSVYADEADLLNVALFGKTAKQWRGENPKSKGNIREAATLEQLVVLSNLESVNAVFIDQGFSQEKRLALLNQTAIKQMRSLLTNPSVKKLK